MGAVQSLATPNTHEPVEDPKHKDVDEAVNYASDLIEAIEHLTSMTQCQEKTDALGSKLLNVAVEGYIEKFDIPNYALEDYPVANTEQPEETPTEETSAEASKLKKVLLYLYALVKRVFSALFDFFNSQKLTARKTIPLTKEYIGRSDSLSASVGAQLNIRDRSLMVALHIDGLAPRKLPELYDNLADTFIEQYQHSAVSQTLAVLAAAKTRDREALTKAAEVLRDKLARGFRAGFKQADANDMALFNEKKEEGKDYWISPVLFGQNYITGVIGHEINEDGTFSYSCGIKRDPEVPLRTAFFPVLTPDEIRHVCRTSLRISENIIRFSKDEDLLQKALREASFIATKEVDKTAVTALKELATIGQSSYIVYLRYTSRVMQSLMRWCNSSIKLYEQVKKENG